MPLTSYALSLYLLFRQLIDYKTAMTEILTINFPFDNAANNKWLLHEVSFIQYKEYVSD